MRITIKLTSSVAAAKKSHLEGRKLASRIALAGRRILNGDLASGLFVRGFN
jgi:hypothetical protein